MPVSKLKELPKGGDGRWPLCGVGFRSVHWGDLEVGYTDTDVGNHSALYEGLPGGLCPCPHYGYIFSGRLRCHYPNSDYEDEVAETGDVYFFRPGHVLIYEEPTQALEMNPAGALQDLMDHIEKKVAKMIEAGDFPAP